MPELTPLSKPLEAPEDLIMSPKEETDQGYTEVTTEIDDAELSVSQEARTKRAIQLSNRLAYQTLGESSE